MPKTAEEIAKWAEDKELPELSEIAPFTATLQTTDQRKRLLAAMSLPQSASMTAIDICRYANIDRKTYYLAVRDPGFNVLQTQLARQLNSSSALHYRHKYHELADKLHPGALERLNEQTGVLDPPQRNINLSATVVNTSLTELKALLKEQQIDDAEVMSIVDGIEGGK